MWPPSTRPTLGYTLPSEMGMFVVAPTFHTSTGNNNTNPNQPDHHHHHHHHSLVSDPHAHLNPSSTALGVGVGVGVIPLLTATPCLGAGVGGFESDDLMNRSRTHGGGGGGGGIQLWHTTQQHNQLGSYNNNTSTSKKSTINFEQHDAAPTNISCLQTSSGGSGTATCQDCGNQAKKDCSHRRCRTCCRSRGFDCSTHVKSTWVPAARRRERQMIGGPVGTTGGCGGGGGGGGGASSGSTSGVKKPRLISSQNTATTSHTSTSNTPPRSFDTSSSHQDASFKESLPGQVKAPAVFKCVRVTAVEDGDDEYAYQAVVKIGGHVFKGFLYDQGIESREGFPNLSELHLGGGGRSNGVSSSSPLIDPTDVYGSSGGAGGLLGGSSYGNTVT